MTRAKSVYAQVQTEFKAWKRATQLTQDPTGFISFCIFFLLGLISFYSHSTCLFLLSSLPLCFSSIASHLLLSLFLPYALFICLSPYSWPFQCKILSPPWFQVLNGYGFVRGVAGVRDRRSAVYWGKVFSKSQKRLEKRAKAECTKHAMYVLQQDLRGDILIDWAQPLTRGEAAIWDLQLLNQNFKQAPFVQCPMCTDKW